VIAEGETEDASLTLGHRAGEVLRASWGKG
jgi:hypothetical protein